MILSLLSRASRIQALQTMLCSYFYLLIILSGCIVLNAFFITQRPYLMKSTKLLALIVLMSSTYAMADNTLSVTLTGGALVQSVSLSATTQASVTAQTPVAVTAVAPTLTQTASVTADTLLPVVTDVHTSGTVTIGSTGVGTASITGINSASAFSIIPVISVGALAVVPSAPN